MSPTYSTLGSKSLSLTSHQASIPIPEPIKSHTKSDGIESTTDKLVFTGSRTWKTRRREDGKYDVLIECISTWKTSYKRRVVPSIAS